jgi:3-oxoacyl-(acyl-carrier-protein) synthase
MTVEEESVALSNRGRDWVVDPEYASPFLYGASSPGTLASEIACAFGAYGPVTALTTGSVAGIDAVALGCELIAEDEADVVIAGASESPVTPAVLGGFDPIKATSARNEEPARASRPFDRDRDGFVLAEGAAILLLEELEAALARHAHIYCEIAGCAAHSNAYHMTGLGANGDELAAAINDAMRRAGVRPSSIDYIGAQASGSRQGDRHEVAAYSAALGERARGTPVSSIKGAIGHALGAAGALQVAACALAIDRGNVPPTANLDVPDPAGALDYIVDRAREGLVQAALTTASSMGGFQSAMVLVRPSELRHGPGGSRP